MNTEQRIVQSLMFELDEAKAKIAALEQSQTTEGTRSEPPVTEIGASGISDVMPTNECDHLVYMSEGRPARMHARLRLTFCPKCGVKL